MLPAGRLREPLHNLDRSDVVVLMRDQLNLDLSILWSDVRQLATNAPVYEAEKSIIAVKPIEGLFRDSPASTEVSLPKGSFAFCGLGNPQNFYSTLGQAGAIPAGMMQFVDHHKYVQRDVIEIEKEASAVGATSLFTTAKDAVKLQGLIFQMPCYVVEIGVKLDNAEGFAKML